MSLVETAVTFWQSPFLQGWLLTLYYGDRVGHGLWVQDGQGVAGKTRPEERDPAYRPGPPRIYPLARIPHSQLDIPGYHPVAESPR